MKTTDVLYIADNRVEFKKDFLRNNSSGSWYFKAGHYEIEVFFKNSDLNNLYIEVSKNTRIIGSQKISIESSNDRVLGIISKIISSYSQSIKELEEWADKQSEKDYLF